MSDYDLAQLRHAYLILKRGSLRDMGGLADGIIAPVIRNAEKARNG